MEACLCLQTCTLGLLQQVGSVLGALVFKGTMTEKQASTLVNSAARASAGPGGSTTLQRLTWNMWAAVGKQRAACGRAEERAVEDKQTEIRQLAELHQPRVHSPFLSQNKGLLIICLSVSLRVTHCLFELPYKLFFANLPVVRSLLLSCMYMVCNPFNCLMIFGAHTSHVHATLSEQAASACRLHQRLLRIVTYMYIIASCHCGPSHEILKISYRSMGERKQCTAFILFITAACAGSHTGNDI